MTQHLTGICAHCGRGKEEHEEDFETYSVLACADSNIHHFEDSGEKRLQDHAPELLQAAMEVEAMYVANTPVWRKLQAVILKCTETPK